MVVIKHLIIMNKNAKIYVAGHTGLVGSALMRGLERHGYINIITVALSDFSCSRLISLPDTASRSLKSGAFVPSGIIFEGVRAISFSLKILNKLL